VVVEATWTRQGNVIKVRDLEGRLYTQPLGPNDDPEHVARKLLREKHGRHGSFYNRINRAAPSPRPCPASNGGAAPARPSPGRASFSFPRPRCRRAGRNREVG
jgi:hypothetical protein